MARFYPSATVWVTLTLAPVTTAVPLGSMGDSVPRLPMDLRFTADHAPVMGRRFHPTPGLPTSTPSIGYAVEIGRCDAQLLSIMHFCDSS